MGNICKNLCSEFKAKRNTKEGMYNQGYKYCSCCNEFFKTYETFCLCCGTHLRMKSANKKPILSIKSENEK